MEIIFSLEFGDFIWIVGFIGIYYLKKREYFCDLFFDLDWMDYY